MRRRHAVAVLAVLTAAACDAPFSIAPPVKTIRIAPDSAALETGDTLVLSITLTDSAGRPASLPVYWSSSADSLATVSQSGVVVTLLPGNVTITAAAGGLSAGIPIRIAPRMISIQIDQGSVQLAVGGALPFTASGRDARGNILRGRPVTWTSSDSTVVSIDATGRALALHPGAATITTSYGPLQRSVAVLARTMRFVALSASQADHTCGLTDDGVAACWGANDLGQLGVPALAQSASPIAGLGAPIFAVVAAGATFTCAGQASGDVDCWGSSSRGRLGAGTSQLSTAAPVPVPTNSSLYGLVSGWNHTCGADGAVTYCWGENPAAGGTDAVSWTPTQLAGEIGFTTLMAGVGFGCGLASGNAYCWGTNAFGQLGNGSTAATSVPVPVAGALQYVSLSGGWTHTCGITTSGTAQCWGDGRAGQLGAGDTLSHLTPVPVSGGLTFQSIAAGASRTCAVTTDGTGYCWGNGVLTPVAIPGAPSFVSVVLGDYHTCALGTDGRAYCWGLNNRGQLGNGTFTDQAAPTPVLGQP